MARKSRPRFTSRSALRTAIIVALLVCIFVADTLTDFEIAVAAFYIVVILVAIGLLPRRGVTALAGVCVALTVLSLLLTQRGYREAGVFNAAISISAIAITTYLALRTVTAVAAVHESRAQLARIARLTSLGELTASIAHEVNQPLAAIVTSGNACLRWMNMDPPNVGKARASVERMVSDANRASEVIERVRGLARGGTPHREWLNVNDTIGDALDLARGEIDRQAIALRVSLGTDLPAVLGDQIQLQQVIANLILNAIEAMGDAPGHERVLSISSVVEAGQVVVAIADSGVGLSSDALNRLFDAFWSTKQGGVGIGLTISRSIIEAHGGRIWATPRPSAGAVFQFSLPAGKSDVG
jgi:C4-dicarboxylate-specific signal transduction histidine kinase